MNQASGIGRAEACANIALSKYWGKSDRGDNLTAVPSLSLTLDALRTRTEVSLSDAAGDSVELGELQLTGRPLDRVSALLSRMRAISGRSEYAQVKTENNFPTAAGLASSASGFAALSVAAAQAYGLDLPAGKLAAEARKSSASAGRSLFAGFAELLADADEASEIAPQDHWDVAMVVAVVTAGQKPISSTGGMVQTAKTCPYYPAWVSSSPALFERVKAGVLSRDFEKVAASMEESTRLMHATMMTSVPPVLYLRGSTIELMHEISARRAQGEAVAYTMDAGPNVKVFTLAPNIAATETWLRSFPGVSDVIVCRPGPAAAYLDLNGPLGDAPRVREVS